VSHTGAEAAVAAAGGQVKLAQALGVTQQSVSEWVRRGWFPLPRARKIVELYGVRITDLVHPDIVALVEKAA
jgi:hypothetical protein